MFDEYRFFNVISNGATYGLMMVENFLTEEMLQQKIDGFIKTYNDNNFNWYLDDLVDDLNHNGITADIVPITELHSN